VSQLSQSQPEKFPVWVLPEPVLSFVLEAAEALGVDPALIAGPCLAVLAGCIGNRRKIVLKSSWSEACVLWVAVVMPSGSKKTPAINSVLEHLHKLKAAESADSARRLLVSDITTEALLLVHARAPLGLLNHRDELGGWLKGFDQYKSGKGSDAQTWAEMYQGKPCIIDRKTSGTLSVPRAAVSIVGGIQPEILRKALCGEHLYDGVASRVLFIAVPERPKQWNENTISDKAREGWSSLLNELLELQPNEDDTPLELPLSSKAKAAWVSYVNEHGKREEDEEEGPIRAAMSKLEGATARLALIIQLAKNPQSVQVYAKAMEAAIEISNWFEGQARRIYQGFEETAQERDRRAAYEWIARKGGSTTPHDFAHGGPYRLRKRASEVLNDLVAAGLAARPKNRGAYTLCDSCDRPMIGATHGST
jgi:hypothetical protein